MGGKGGGLGGSVVPTPPLGVEDQSAHRQVATVGLISLSLVVVTAVRMEEVLLMGGLWTPGSSIHSIGGHCLEDVCMPLFNGLGFHS